VVLLLGGRLHLEVRVHLQDGGLRLIAALSRLKDLHRNHRIKILIEWLIDWFNERWMMMILILPPPPLYRTYPPFSPKKKMVDN
jgi:hypothetical protein